MSTSVSACACYTGNRGGDVFNVHVVTRRAMVGSHARMHSWRNAQQVCRRVLGPCARPSFNRYHSCVYMCICIIHICSVCEFAVVHIHILIIIDDRAFAFNILVPRLSRFPLYVYLLDTCTQHQDRESHSRIEMLRNPIRDFSYRFFIYNTHECYKISILLLYDYSFFLTLFDLLLV